MCFMCNLDSNTSLQDILIGLKNKNQNVELCITIRCCLYVFV